MSCVGDWMGGGMTEQLEHGAKEKKGLMSDTLDRPCKEKMLCTGGDDYHSWALTDQVRLKSKQIPIGIIIMMLQIFHAAICSSFTKL